MPKRTLLLVALVCVLANPAIADTVYFRGESGSISEATGTVIKSTSDRVELILTDGSRMIVPRDRVFQIQRSAAPPSVPPGAPVPASPAPVAPMIDSSPGTTRVRVLRYREPAYAFLWSLLIPGAGQFYNGDAATGVLFLGGAIVGIAIVANADPFSPDWEGDVRLGQSIAFGSAIASMIEAPLSASRYNRKNGFHAGAGFSDGGPQLVMTYQF